MAPRYRPVKRRTEIELAVDLSTETARFRSDPTKRWKKGRWLGFRNGIACIEMPNSGVRTPHVAIIEVLKPGTKTVWVPLKETDEYREAVA